MKKFISFIAILLTIGACNNAADSNASGGSSTASDTMDKAVIPPPVPVDTSFNQSDSLKAKPPLQK